MADIDFRSALAAYGLPQFDRTLARLQTVNPAYQQQFLNVLIAAAKAGINPVVMDAARSIEEQDQLFNSGRGVTRAPGGSSYHNYGAAIDIVPNEVLGDANWMPDSPVWGRFGDIVRGVEGVRWGGDFSTLYDPSHVEIATTLAALRGGQTPVPSSGPAPTAAPAAAAAPPATGNPIASIPTPPALAAVPGAFQPPSQGLGDVFLGAFDQPKPQQDPAAARAAADQKRRQGLADIMAGLIRG